MKEQHTSQHIKEKVLEAIRGGKVEMRPRWRFVFEAVLLGTGAMLLGLVLLYLVSFILFMLRQTGIWFIPWLDSRGIVVFLQSLPWVLIILSVIFLIVLEVLVRRYSFAHRKPLLYSMLALLCIITIGGVAVAPWHGDLFDSAREDKLPILGGLYRNFGLERLEGIRKGRITEFSVDNFVMEDLRGITSTIFVTPSTHLVSRGGFKKGDMVVVFGDEMDNGIEADTVQEITK